MREFIPEEVKCFTYIINQLFEIEQKANKAHDASGIKKNIEKIRDFLQSGLPNHLCLSYHNPIGEKYDEMRTDCDARIAGSSTNNLAIVDVIKPIIRISQKQGVSVIIQKGVVIVESVES